MIIRASPIKQYIKIWGTAIPAIVILYLILSFLNMHDLIAPVVVIIAGIAVILSGVYRYVYNHHYLKLSDTDVVYYTGILNISTINVPYHKIDNVRIKRELLSRILGLVDIYIDTPGEKGVEIMARDMPYSEYQAFYAELRKKMEEKKRSDYP